MDYVIITLQIKISMSRDFKIIKKGDEWYHVVVTDSYGNEYDNYFEFAHEASDWVNHVWNNEDWFNSANSQELLYNAIENCKRIDEKSNRKAIL